MVSPVVFQSIGRCTYIVFAELNADIGPEVLRDMLPDGRDELEASDGNDSGDELGKRAMATHVEEYDMCKQRSCEQRRKGYCSLTNTVETIIRRTSIGHKHSPTSIILH